MRKKNWQEPWSPRNAWSDPNRKMTLLQKGSRSLSKASKRKRPLRKHREARDQPSSISIRIRRFCEEPSQKKPKAYPKQNSPPTESRMPIADDAEGMDINKSMLRPNHHRRHQTGAPTETPLWESSSHRNQKDGRSSTRTGKGGRKDRRHTSPLQEDTNGSRPEKGLGGRVLSK